MAESRAQKKAGKRRRYELTPLEADMRRAYQTQHRAARTRGIPFLFMFAEWQRWWLTEDRWSRRGKRRHQLVMARIGDAGAYEPDNVHCLTPQGNILDRPIESRQRSYAKGALTRGGPPRHWQGKFGKDHPKSRPILTPDGAYESATQAAVVHGLTRQAATKRAQNGILGWSYAR